MSCYRHLLPWMGSPRARRALSGALVAAFAAAAAALGTVQGRLATPEQQVYAAEIRPLLERRCLSCHGGQGSGGGLALASFRHVRSIQQDPETWRQVIGALEDRRMPPPGSPPLTDGDRERLVAWLRSALDRSTAWVVRRSPGRVVLHRLSRLEYNNTVRDLFGVHSRPADDFPADGGGGGGFDNNADTLFLPPVLMERYLAAAGRVVREAPASRILVARPGPKVAPRAAARRILAHFVPRAYRRRIEAREMPALLGLYDAAVRDGESHEDAVRFALKALLVSPSFLFRVERERPESGPYPVSDYELASRLSYFLWASMPDDELFRLAAAQRLRDPAVLEGQVRRMLRDPKSRALAGSFVEQWLQVRELSTSVRPDPSRFPSYRPSLRDAMAREPVECFAALLRGEGKLLDLLDADYTYLNEELAAHYGVPGVRGPDFRRVALPDRRRGGLVTMASVLTVTSYPLRTSPVLRGKWLLERLLGTTVPPPPTEVPALPPGDEAREGLSLRQQLERHRTDAACASCHARMDPIGFGLENYDPVGQWRETIAGASVDAAGVLPGGERFAGPAGLKAHLLTRRDDFTRTLTEKLLAYALGRGLEPYDRPTVRHVTAAVARDGYRASTLVREIVKSYPFQCRENR